MPTGRDGELVCAMLERECIDCEVVEPDFLASKVGEDVGAVLVAEEALKDGVLSEIESAVVDQPVWSDIPLIVFSISTTSAESLLQALSGRFNATIVERPIRITILISAKGASSLGSVSIRPATCLFS